MGVQMLQIGTQTLATYIKSARLQKNNAETVLVYRKWALNIPVALAGESNLLRLKFPESPESADNVTWECYWTFEVIHKLLLCLR